MFMLGTLLGKFSKNVLFVTNLHKISRFYIKLIKLYKNVEWSETERKFNEGKIRDFKEKDYSR